MFFRFTVLLVSVIANITACGQEKFTIREDLSYRWLEYSDGRFSSVRKASVDDKKRKSIHFSLRAGDYANDFLKIYSDTKFYLFIDGRVVREHEGSLILPMDSLMKEHRASNMMISVFRTRATRLVTEIISSETTRPGYIMHRKPSADLKNFAALAGLSLIIFFVVMVNAHPKLSAEYFSLPRILAMREGEDKDGPPRFALSSNIWFYVFFSLLLSLFLLLLFLHLPEKYANNFPARPGFSLLIREWIKLGGFILAFLMLKVLLIVALSSLFGLTGIAGLHFFNSIRLLLTVTAALSVIAFIYFISGGRDESVFTIFLTILVLTLLVWVILIFFKLNRKTEHSMFHLFSYICATEVIPLLLTMKVLFQ